MIKVGQYYTLPVSEIVEAGYILDAKELGGVLLPKAKSGQRLEPGDTVAVFLYLDTDDELAATTEKPKACVGEFAYLKVAARTNVGAFLDWGLDKDVLVPFAEQHVPMEEGHSYLVYLYLDKIDGRITATSKIDKVLDDLKPHDYLKGQPVDLIIANSTDLGFKAIINHGHWGVLYESDVFQRLSFGQSIKGYIKHIRPDGKIDLTLQSGQESRDKNAETILALLREQDGFVALHDKSDPQVISKLLGMSKGAFKKSIGNLYRQRLIQIEQSGIRLLQDSPPASENVWLKKTETAPETVTETLPETLPEKPEKLSEHLSKAHAKTPSQTLAKELAEKSSEKPSYKQSEQASEGLSKEHSKTSAQPLPDNKDARIVLLNREPVELYKIIKFEGLVGSGGEAKSMIADGMVKLNGKVETQKRKKIMSGDVIEVLDEKIRLQLGNTDDQ